MTRTLVLLAALMTAQLAAFPAAAQMSVYVGATAPDPVGTRLAYAIREGIRRSAAMTLVDREQDGFLSVRMVSLDPDRSDSPNGNRTIYSVVWTTKTFRDTPVTMYLTSSVGICGSNRVAQCAEALVADTDSQVSQVRGWIQDVADKSRK